MSHRRTSGALTPVHHDQTPHLHAQLLKRLRTGKSGWTKQHDATALWCNPLSRDRPPGHHGRQQAHLPNPRLRQQQLGQHTTRPAASGQLGIQGLEAGGHHPMHSPPQLVRTPDLGVKLFGMNQHRHEGRR